MIATTSINIVDSVASSGTGMSLTTNFPQVIAWGVNMAIILGSLLFLLYLLLGGINWITAGGDKGKVEAARNKIVQGAIGLLLVVAAYTVYLFLLNILGINLGAGGFGSAARSAGGGSNNTGVCTVGQVLSDGGAGGYCTDGGSAKVKCVAAGQGPSGYNYPHFEPCDCEGGTSPKATYTFVNCN